MDQTAETSGVTIDIIDKRRTKRRSDNSDVLRGGGGGLGKASMEQP